MSKNYTGLQISKKHPATLIVLQFILKMLTKLQQIAQYMLAQQ
ncbi:MAG: hypothetical protein O7C59_09430 [Rickettsia endosymbiont of Ixodes persulcatus]|nr:hypothetical protein [Rickettsia endosymbiont of Ixodes persulcatus]MCZ6909473.1 hypothetical protein [Rickettsia endosymbiont of Ixodes persulcatus]MCZ6914646.1 hypothetical protein [Rickettsia endosymbiont of Ixodes persulcatus]MCZ6919995.1 hypothetical protein [Rickettsia endosymbiont of Ixodes persulcatus]MCZ6924587.1 hypothetical protein [Rickettsia endosymbiont of Ixodes persulcatus]